MKNLKDKTFFVRFPVFGYDVRVEFTSDLKKSVSRHEDTKAVDLSGPEDKHTDALAIHVAGEGKSFVFLLHHVSLGTIAHESWQVVRHMFDSCGAALENESVAYHLGYLVNQIVNRRKTGTACRNRHINR